MTHAIIVPDGIRAIANQAAHQLGIDPEGTLTTMCVPLVPSDGPDDAEPTHWGACGHMPEEAREHLAANLGQFPGAMWIRWGSDGVVVAAHTSDLIGTPGGWLRLLAFSGLKVRVSPMPS